MRSIVVFLVAWTLMLPSVNGQTGTVSYVEQMRQILSLNLVQAVDETSSGSLPDMRVSRTREFVKLMFVQSHHDYQRFVDHTDQDLRQIKNIRLNPFKAYLEVEWHLMLAFASSQFNDYKKSALELLRAWKLADRNRSILPLGSKDRLFGILGVLFDQIPDNYRKILPLIGVDFEPGRGHALLVQSFEKAKRGSLDQLESVIILLVAEYEFSEDAGTVWDRARQLEPILKSNPVVGYLTGLAALKAGYNDLAIPIMIGAKEAAKESPAMMDYQLGRMYLYRGEPEARSYLERFISEYRGDNYRKTAFQKLAWFWLVQGEQTKYSECISSIKSLPTARNEPDEQVERECSSAEIPNPELLQLRILFDGGYYSRCIEKAKNLEMNKLVSGEELSEVYYRLGRCHYVMNDLGEAKSYFSKVIENQGILNNYMLPYSAYFLGLISFETGNLDQAADHLHNCLKWNRFGYRDGIERKAQKLLRNL